MARILVVDDEEDYRALLEHILERAGHEVLAADCGQAGLAAAAESRPALIILDAQMPDLEGYEVCRRLRARGDATPVIFCTVRSAVSRVAEGLRAGGNDYVVKPFAPEDLLARVREALEPGKP
ncbi:MAG: response regulator transcription factor [Elusimicrobia bacterium]|nr:response regulator transcription factor [Elusimicrobiota bacterium]